MTEGYIYTHTETIKTTWPHIRINRRAERKKPPWSFLGTIYDELDMQ